MSAGLGEREKDLPRGSVDIRRLIELLIPRWRAIAATTVLAGGLAFAVASLQPPVYEASAVIAITEPRRTLEFEPLYTAVIQSESAYRSFAPLATSHEVLENVLHAYRSSTAAVSEGLTLNTLSQMMEVRPDDEALLVTLAVRSRSPEEAAVIANLWGNFAAAQANQVYATSEEHIQFLERELADAAQDLQDAEQALLSLRQHHRTSILSLTLTSAISNYGQYLEDQQALTYTIQEIQGMRDRLLTEPAADHGSPTEQMDLLLSAVDEQTQARIHLPSERVDALSVEGNDATTAAFLGGLLADLERRSAEVDERLSELEPRILALQEELQSAAGEESSLVNTRDAAREMHLALARELEEAQLAAMKENWVARVAAGAIPPEHAVAPLKTLYVGVTSILGLTISVLAVWARAWWRNGKLGRDATT